MLECWLMICSSPAYNPVDRRYFLALPHLVLSTFILSKPGKKPTKNQFLEKINSPPRYIGIMLLNSRTTSNLCPGYRGKRKELKPEEIHKPHVGQIDDAFVLSFPQLISLRGLP